MEYPISRPETGEPDFHRRTRFHGFSRFFFSRTSAFGRVSRTEWSKNVTNNNQLVLKTTSNRNCGPEAV